MSPSLRALMRNWLRSRLCEFRDANGLADAGVAVLALNEVTALCEELRVTLRVSPETKEFEIPEDNRPDRLPSQAPGVINVDVNSNVLKAARITRSQIGVFSRQDLAESFAYTNGAKPLRVILGEEGQYWVVTPAVAARLERLGYEYCR